MARPRTKEDTMSTEAPSTDPFTRREYELLAVGWDAAVQAMRYSDGTPVDLAANVNPFRAKL